MSFVVRGPESMAGGSLYSSYVLEEKTTKCERFRKYMWNAEETTCCKRTPKYWCKLILFYTLFAALIFGVFFLSLHYISIFIRDSSDAKKNLIEDNCPGISFLPKIGDKRSHLIWYSFTGKQRLDYTDHIKRYLEKYQCTDADSTCIFPLANLSVCSKEDYGFKEKKPCFYLKLNKFSEWEPEYYSKILPQYMPSSLKKIISKSSTKEYIWVHCDGETEADKEHLGNVTYYPQPGFSGHYFPYKTDSEYLSPLVAVKLNNIKPGRIVRVKCTTWAKNIDSTRPELSGTFPKFYLDLR